MHFVPASVTNSQSKHSLQKGGARTRKFLIVDVSVATVLAIRAACPVTCPDKSTAPPLRSLLFVATWSKRPVAHPE